MATKLARIQYHIIYAPGAKFWNGKYKRSLFLAFRLLGFSISDFLFCIGGSVSGKIGDGVLFFVEYIWLNITSNFFGITGILNFLYILLIFFYKFPSNSVCRRLTVVLVIINQTLSLVLVVSG